MRSRPKSVSVAAILLALFSLVSLPLPLLPGGRRSTGGSRLRRCCAEHCGPRCHRRVVEAQKVGLVAHHCSFAA